MLFLGCQPRYYFDGEDASPPLDVTQEAAALAEWARSATGADVDPAEIDRLAASDDLARQPQDVFVEETVVRLLRVLGVPLPGMLVA